MKLTVPLLRAAYTMLRETEPFSGWRLPHADEVEFEVGGTGRHFGDHTLLRSGKHRIRVSEKMHDRLSGVLETLAHEICHMRQRRSEKRRSAIHGKRFRQLADQVCAAHREFNRAYF